MVTGTAIRQRPAKAQADDINFIIDLLNSIIRLISNLIGLAEDLRNFLGIDIPAATDR